MKKTKGFLIILLCLVFVFAAFTACKTDETPKGDGGGGNKEPAEYTVTFEVNGGTPIEPKKVEEGKTVERPADPTKSGFEFVGWYEDAAFSKEFSFSSPITSDITVYAKWSETEVYYTVTFESNGGTPVKAQSVLKGSRAQEPSDPDKTDYLFDGWYTDSAFTKKFDFATPITANVTLYAKWLENVFYDVKFYPGDNQETIVENVRKGAVVPQPVNPTQDGYVFAGWYTDEAFTSPYDFTIPVTEDLDIYGKWLADTDEYYTVTFETFEGSKVGAIAVEKGMQIFVPADPVFENYEFTGWYTDKNCTLPFDFSTGIERNMTLYAGWKDVVYYDVYFDTDGGTAIQTERVKGGELVERPSVDPVKEGYYFTGWFADKNGTMPFDFSLPVTKDTTVYAVYRVKPFYHVQFDVNGGTPVPEYASVQEGNTVNAPTEPVKEGYEFGGWYTDVDLTVSASFPYKVTGNVTFYAKWLDDEDYITVNFDIAICNENGAYTFDKPFEMSSYRIKKGSKIYQPENPEDMTATDVNGVKHTMMFSYWNFEKFYTENGGITVPSVDMILFPIELTDVKEITLYAVYREIKEGETRATLAIHPNNGEDATYVYGVLGKTIGARLDASNHPMYSAPGVKPIREGYEITGYYKTPGLSTDTDDDIYQIPFLLEKEFNDCYLRWEKHEDIDIIYDYDRNDGIVDYTVKAQYNGFATRPSDPYREGYTFDGWYTQKNNNPEDLFDFENTRITDKIISTESSGREYVWLFAKWVADPCLVTFDVNNGKPITSVSVTAGETLGELPTPTRSGYYFDGWYKDRSYETPFSADEPITSDVTLYAKWIASATDMNMFELNLTNGGYEVTLADHVNKSQVTELVIPAAYGNYPVRTVYGFSDMQNLQRVVIPETVTTIQYRAFSNCASLESVEIQGDNLRTIGFDAFSGCSSLSSITFEDADAPYKLVYVYADIFRDCPDMITQLEEVNGLYYWYDICLGDYSTITSTYFTAEDGTLQNIQIKEGTRVLAALSLYNQVVVDTLDIPEGVKYANYMSFPWSENIRTLNLPSTLTTISESVPSNGERMFAPSLETINVADGNKVYEMANGCLVDKSESRVIASVASADSLPSGYRSIGVYAFTEKQLDTVNIPSSYIEIMANAFDGCAFTSLVIPDSVGILSSAACSDCKNLAEITFGSSVNVIDVSFFSSMKALSMINVSEDNKYMYSVSGILYNESDDSIIYVPENLAGDITFREGITELPYDLFSGVSKDADITSLVFPDSLVVYPEVKTWDSLKYVYIGTGAAEDTFSGTSAGNWYNWLNDVRLPYAYTPFMIEISPDCEYMYSNGKGGIIAKADGMLLYVYTDETSALVLDDGIKSISPDIDFTDYWFESIHIGATFGNIESLPLDTTYVSEITVSEDNPYYAEKDGILYSKDFTRFVIIPVALNRDVVELPKELQEIPDKAFYFGEGYGEDTGPFFGIYPYPGNAFEGLKIGTLTVEEGSQLTSIGEKAFANANYIQGWNMIYPEITKIDFSNATNLVSIGNNAFEGSMELTEVVLANVVEIGDRAFNYCNAMTSFTVNSGLYSIGTAAFESCTALETLELPSTVEYVGASAFFNCGKILDENGFFITDDGRLLSADSRQAGSSVTIADNVTAIISNVFYGWSILEEIYIPSSVQYIGVNAFGNNSALVIRVQAAQKPEGWEDGWNGSGDTAVTAVVWDCDNNQFAEDGTAVIVSDGIRYKLYADQTAQVITQLDPVEGDIIIPAQVTFADKQYAVKGIEDNVFQYNEAITSVVIEEGVESIGSRAFQDASNLVSLTLPTSLVSVGDYAFANTAITSATVEPNTVYGIGVFANNGMLTQATIKEGVTSVPEGIFKYSGLTSVTLPSTVETIEHEAFAYSPSLASAQLPAGLKEIGNIAFASTALTDVDFSGLTQLTAIGSDAFANTKLTSVVVPYCVSYGKGAFETDTLTSATIAVSGVLAESIFGNESNLEELVFTGTAETSIADCDSSHPFIKVNSGKTLRITFNEGMKSIGSYAFYKAGSLDLVFNEGLESIGSYAFGYAAIANLNTPASLKNIGASAFKYATIEQLTLAEGLETIGADAFYDTLHPDVALPTTIRELGSGAFENSYDGTVQGKLLISGAYPYLTNLGKYATERSVWSGEVVLGSAENGVTIEGSSTTYYTVSGEGSADLTLYVSSIADYAFRSSSLLTSVRLIGVGDNATVGKQAFYGVRNLKDVYVENISEFGDYAFGDSSTSTASSITSVTIGSGISSLGKYMFYCISSLKTVTFETDEVTDIGDYAFYKTGLNSVVLPSGVQSLGKYAFAMCKSLSELVLNEGLLSVGDFAFYGSTMDEVIIPSTLATVGSGIFYSCPATVTVPFAEDALPEGWSSSWNNKHTGEVIYQSA